VRNRAAVALMSVIRRRVVPSVCNNRRYPEFFAIRSFIREDTRAEDTFLANLRKLFAPIINSFD